MKKLILASAMVLMLGVNSVFAVTFSDVKANTDYKNAIEWMAQNGVIEGYSDGTFQPDRCVNRVEFLKMLYSTNGQDLTAATNVNLPFSDVNLESWYDSYLKTAYLNGVVHGYPDGTFKPNRCVNRVEAIKMAMEGFDISPYRLDLGWGWEDLKNNEWYFDYVFAVLDKNLVGLEHVTSYVNEAGWNISRFYPAQSMSRKEVAEMLYRMRAMKDNNLNEYNVNAVPKNVEGTTNSGWITHVNPAHNFSFQYPAGQGFKVEDYSGMGGGGFEEGQFGSSVYTHDYVNVRFFDVSVFYTPEWTSLGNAYGDVDALEDAFQLGGIKEVARVSREIHLQEAQAQSDMQVGELREFNFQNGTGYGFSLTKLFNFCFNLSNNNCSGGIISASAAPINVIYVTNGEDIYMIRFSVNSIGNEVFPTFIMPAAK